VATYYKTYQVLILIQSVKILPDCAFVSSDDLYLNRAAIFELKDEAIETPKTPKKEIVRQQSTDELLDKCLKFTEQKSNIRTETVLFIHLFASNANRF
jgi:hypothetical protein